MSLASLIAADVSDVFLDTDEHAASVTRYPAGDTTSPATVTAIWCEDELATDSKTRGRDIVRMGSLRVDDAQATDPKDRWLIDSETWETIAVGKEEGMKKLRLQRVEPESRNTGPTVLT